MMPPAFLAHFPERYRPAVAGWFLIAGKSQTTAADVLLVVARDATIRRKRGGSRDLEERLDAMLAALQEHRVEALELAQWAQSKRARSVSRAPAPPASAS